MPSHTPRKRAINRRAARKVIRKKLKTPKVTTR